MAFYESNRDNEKNFIDFFISHGCLPHFHSAIEILVVESGLFSTNINGKLGTIKEGDILICNSYDVHGYKPIDDSIGHCIIVPKNMLNSFFSAAKNSKFSDNIINNSNCFSHVMSLVELIKFYSVEAARNHKVISSLAKSIFLILTRYLTLSGRTVDKDNIKDILFYIYDNFEEPITLNGIAKRFGYTPNHFSYIFNSYMQINLSTFINNLRAEKSLELLENGSSITLAAENSGFKSLRTFYRTFNQKYGCTPTEYKNRLLQN